MKASKLSDQCQCRKDEQNPLPLSSKTFRLFDFLNKSINTGLANIKKLNENHSIDYNSPPNINGKILESGGNINNEYYTFLSNLNNNIDNNNKTNDLPWKKYPYYFRTVNISLLTMLKMSLHAISGGSIEIMGMLMGYRKGNELIILDCYPLPVQGTESRVNPQNDSYEFMLSYITKLHENGIKRENIVGWYHSHPGFGCWLSGIDVQTQKLHQSFEDPYVAIVIDPIKSLMNDVIDIGAFRTLYDEHLKKENNDNNYKNNNDNPNSDLGWHAKEYYALDIKIFANENDKLILEKFKSMKSYSNLTTNTENYIDDDNDNDNLIDLKGIDINDSTNKDLDSIKLWKNVNKVLENVSIRKNKSLNIQSDKKNELLANLLSLDSGEIDIKTTNKFTPDFHPKHSNTDKDINTTSTGDNTLMNHQLNKTELNKLNIGKMGLEMDMISADEIKHLLIKDIQRGLFE